MLSLIWRDDALDDLDRIFTYIADHDLQAAEKLHVAIQSCAERLPTHPFMYRLGRVPGTREAIVHPNYVLVYSVGADAIEVLSLLHTRQRYP